MQDGTATPTSSPADASNSRGASRLHRWLRRIRRAVSGAQHRMIVHSLILAVLTAGGAIVFIPLVRLCQQLFLQGIAGYRPPGLPSEGGMVTELIGPQGLWLVPVVTTLGGLVVGWLIYSYAPEAEGHGTDAAIRAFHRADGRLRARIAPLKALASAITIGTGGAAGREGPVALIGATLGSTYARLAKLDADERRLLLVVGLSAGIAAVFRSPIGAAILGVEILYRGMEFEDGALLYTMLASVAAYAITGIFFGWGALFEVPAIAAPSVYTYGWYVLLGLVAGVAATLLPVALYTARDLFERLPGPPHLRPALGGLCLGVLALLVPQVLGGGYGWLQQAMYGQIALQFLLVLAVAKTLAFCLTIGSGGSGGVFAPSLYVGGMLGGALAAIFHQPAAPFVIVGMAALFAGAAHIPVASLIMVTEMTGSYQLLAPAAVALMIAYLVQITLSNPLRYRSLYEAQVGSRADSPAHHAEHLRIALRILDQRKVPLPTGVGRVNLLSFLMAGIPVELQDERRLAVAALKSASPFVGQRLSEIGLHTTDTNIVSIIRGERMRAPRPDTVLEAGDRLLVVVSPDGWSALAPHVEAGWEAGGTTAAAAANAARDSVAASG